MLWDNGKEVTESLTELTKTLKKRFGGKAFADKHRIEIRNKRCRKDETLQSLHSDIRRLAALAFPKIEHKTRDVIACDYFLDAFYPFLYFAQQDSAHFAESCYVIGRGKDVVGDYGKIDGQSLSQTDGNYDRQMVGKDR